MTVLVQAHALRKSFARTEALRGVSVEIGAGETVAITGPSPASSDLSPGRSRSTSSDSTGSARPSGPVCAVGRWGSCCSSASSCPS
jgi:hypothetical protein